MNRLHKYFLVAAISLLTAACSDEPPEPGPDDAGTRAWVRQVMPVVLGRKPRGCNEVQVWADIADQTDRALALQTMMNRREFVEHWTEVLVDVIKVDKEVDFPDFSVSINPVEEADGCFGNPLRNGPVTSDLAAHVLSEATLGQNAPGGAWNMTDLVRSAIELDNLAPIMQANLFAMMDRFYNGNFSEQAKRDVVGRHFGEVYLGRQLDCLGCHNSDWSLTDASSEWNRHAPIVGSFERAIHGSASGADPADFHQVFHPSGYSAGDGSGPWGMTNCGGPRPNSAEALGTGYFGGALPLNANTTTLEEKLRTGLYQLADGLERSVSPSLQSSCNFCSQTCAGVTPLDPMAAANAAEVEALLTSTDPNGPNCGSCHGATLDLYFTGHSPLEDWYTQLIGVPSVGSALNRVEPGDSNDSHLMERLDGGGMPPAGSGQPLSQDDLQKVSNWIDDLQPAHACASCAALDCSGTPRQVESNEAFAFLTATSLYNAIRDHLRGSGLTVAHGFPRTPGQGLFLAVGSEYRFIQSHWSLRQLLIWELLGHSFNRAAPALDTDPTPYDLLMTFDPWVWADPRDEAYDPNDIPRHHNAMTDAVKRYPARTLLNSAADALGWPPPPRLPVEGAYPSKALNQQIGQRFSASNPGFRAVDLAGLLAWESTLGACTAPNGQDDWFDALSERIGAINQAGQASVTIGEVAATVKDRLFSYGEIQSTADRQSAAEQAVLETLAGHVFDTVAAGPGTNLTPAEVAQAGRRVCGGLISSPQFLLAGLATNTACSATLEVCNPGEPCGYQNVCESISDDLPGDLTLLCFEGDLDVVPEYIEPDDDFCPRGVCDLIPRPLDEECLRRPTLACGIDPPGCDPTCLVSDQPACCGGVRGGFLDDVVHVWWADGAQVLHAQDVVRIAGDGDTQPAALGKGDSLNYGDTLILQPGAGIDVAIGKDQQITTKGKHRQARVVVVSGEPALAVHRAKPATVDAARNRTQWLLRDGWLANGAGGQPKNVAMPGQPTGVEERSLAPQGREVQRRVDEWRARVRKANTDSAAEPSKAP